MLNVCVATHPPDAVTVHEYVPAHKPEAVAEVPPLGDHEYVNGPVPVTMLVVADPVQLPAHAMLVCVPESVSEPPPAIVNVCVIGGVHESASSTVQVYVPAQSPVAVAVPCPPPGFGDQL